MYYDKDKFGRIQYYINEDKGVVIAKFRKAYVTKKDEYTWSHSLRWILDMLCKKASKATYVYGENDKTIGLGIDSVAYEVVDYLDQHELYGKAKCSPEDKFDIEIGKEIARKKLLAKYYKFEKSMLEIIHKKFTKFCAEYFENLENRLDLCDYKINKNTVKA